MFCVVLCSLMNIFLGWDIYRVIDISFWIGSSFVLLLEGFWWLFVVWNKLFDKIFRGVIFSSGYIGGMYNIYVYCLKRIVYLILFIIVKIILIWKIIDN